MSLIQYCFLGIINRFFPNHYIVDSKKIKIIETEYGKFHYSKPLQNYYNIFEQVADYKIIDLRDDDVVLDIGACMGVSSIMFARKCRKVYAVEPLFYEELQDNIELNNIKNIELLPFALGEGGVIKFCGKEKIVQGISFKKILEICKETPTFLKMDCEGGEWSINPEDLTGFRAIEAEIHNFSGEDPKRFIQSLEHLGFRVKSYKTKEGQTMISARKLC